MVSLLFACLLSAAPKPTVAVLYFDYSGKDEALAVLQKGLTQILISDLSGLETVRVIEREKLEEVLKEFKLAKTVQLDKATTAKLGKLLGAQYFVLGSYFDMMGALRADARVVEVETGLVIKSVGASGPPGEFMEMEQKLSLGLVEILATVAKSAEAPKVVVSQAPKTMKTKTAVRYSWALVALDKGDKKRAKTELEAALKEQKDFKLAQQALDQLNRAP